MQPCVGWRNWIRTNSSESSTCSPSTSLSLPPSHQPLQVEVICHTRDASPLPQLTEWPGSVWFGFSLCMERFERLRFLVWVPQEKGLSVYVSAASSVCSSSSNLGSCRTVSVASYCAFGSWKTAPKIRFPIPAQFLCPQMKRKSDGMLREQDHCRTPSKRASDRTYRRFSCGSLGSNLKEALAGVSILIDSARADLCCDPAGLVQITKTPESRKYEKITQKYKIPLFGLGPETKKLQKNTKMVIFGPFLYFFGNFFVFSGPKPGRGILYFFVIFSYFRDSGVFVICTRPAGSQDLCVKGIGAEDFNSQSPVLHWLAPASPVNLSGRKTYKSLQSLSASEKHFSSLRCASSPPLPQI